MLFLLFGFLVLICKERIKDFFSLKATPSIRVLTNWSFLPFWYEKWYFVFTSICYIRYLPSRSLLFLFDIWVLHFQLNLHFKDGGLCSVSKLIFHSFCVRFSLSQKLFKWFLSFKHMQFFAFSAFVVWVCFSSFGFWGVETVCKMYTCIYSWNLITFIIIIQFQFCLIYLLSLSHYLFS